MPPGTAHRILDTLTSQQLLRRSDASRAYHLGPRLLQLARGAWEDFDIRDAAIPELDALHGELGETLLLSVLVGGALVIIERRQAMQAARVSPGIGSSLPLHCTAAGKAVLSALTLPHLAQTVFGMELPGVTAQTITDAATLMAHLELAASHHYAVDDEESLAGIRGCAAPILNQQGTPLGAIAFSAPADALPIERCRSIGPKLSAAAERISWNLGFNPPERWADLAGNRRADAVEQVSQTLSYVGSNPLWSPRSNGLFWSDRAGPAIVLSTPDGAERSMKLPAPACGIVELGNELVLLLPDGLHRFDPATGAVSPLEWLDAAEPHGRYATSACDANGRLWITTMDLTLRRPSGKLYRVDPDFSVHCMADGLLFPLGIDWSPANDCIYFSDGPRHEIYCADFDLASGSIGRRSVFARVPDGIGRPTGLAVDRDGYVWNTLSEGWRATRYAPDGAVDRVVQLPVSRADRLFLRRARYAHAFHHHRAPRHPRAPAPRGTTLGRSAGLPHGDGRRRTPSLEACLTQHASHLRREVPERRQACVA